MDVASVTSTVPEGLDLLGLEDVLTREEKAVRDAVRQMCCSVVDGNIEQWSAGAESPDVRELMLELGKLGLLGMQLEGHGCAGMSAVDHGLACLELEASDTYVRSLVTAQGSLAMFAISRFGAEEQKNEWLPRLATGEAIGSFAQLRPELGPESRMTSVSARRKGADWVITGATGPVTNAPVADVAVVWARTADGARCFLVPTELQGFSRPPTHHEVSLQSSVFGNLLLEDVRLPGEALLPGAKGVDALLRCLDEAGYGVLWGVLGAARSALLAAQGQAGQSGMSQVGGAERTAHRRLTEMALEVGTGCLLALHLGRRKDIWGLSPEQVSSGKRVNSARALAVCRSALALMGGRVTAQRRCVTRHLNNLESVKTDEGTADVDGAVFGQALTERSANP